MKKPILLAFSLLLLALLPSCSDKTYTITFVNRDEKTERRLYLTAYTSRPVQLLSENAFGTSDGSKKLIMWSTNGNQDGRSDSELLTPLEEGDLNFKPSALYNGRESLTLYAIWTLPRSTIRFVANGGKFIEFGNSEEDQTDNKAHGVDYSIGSKYMKMRKDNSVFLGWSFENYGAGNVDRSEIDASKILIEGDKVTSNGTVTLYAVWTSGDRFGVINYVLNESSVADRVAARNDGGSFDKIASFSANNTKIGYYSIGGTTSLNDAPIMEGCRFAFWSRQPGTSPDDATAVKYLAGGEYDSGDDPPTEDDGSVTFYAIWRENTYTITYVPDPFGSQYAGSETVDVWINGETSFTTTKDGRTVKAMYSQTKYHFSPLSISGKRLTLKDGSAGGGVINDNNEPVKTTWSEGYKFLGWRRNPTQLLSHSDSITENSSFTLYGQWEEKYVTFTTRFEDGRKTIDVNGASRELNDYLDECHANAAVKFDAATKNSPNPYSKTYKYWSQKDHWSDVTDYVIDDIDGYAPTSEGFAFNGWRLRRDYADGDSSVTSQTRFSLDKFADDGSNDVTYGQDHVVEILSYGMPLYSAWSENSVTYTISFAEGERNDYIKLRPEKSPIHFAPTGFANAEFRYWYHKMNRSSEVVTIEMLNAYDLVSEGFAFKGWYYASAGKLQDADRVTGDTDIALTKFSSSPDGYSYDLTLYSRWEELEVDYVFAFRDGTTADHVITFTDFDGLNSPDYIESSYTSTIKVKYWDHYRNWNFADDDDPDHVDHLTTRLRIEDLEDLTKFPISKYDPFESYWSLSQTADGNKVTSSTEFDLTSFNKLVENEQYSITLYSHWGDPVIGKVMRFYDVDWIIAGYETSSGSNNKVKLLSNAAASGIFAARVYDADNGCVNGACTHTPKEHLQIQNWSASSIRTYVNSDSFRETLFGAGTDLLAANFTTFITTTGRYSSNTTDYLWLPSSSEMEELDNLYKNNSVFKSNVYKASSLMWQRDNQSSTGLQNSLINKYAYDYTRCAINSSEVVRNSIDTARSADTYAFRVMCWMGYEIKDMS